ncbi:MAG: hypothetical protein NTV03_02960 [Candidatus Nomurabacteria bacterium]|jgi:hypothetical protein|nr:hypothetical protein [Candidatus Nomurabacteria bacterium]
MLKERKLFLIGVWVAILPFLGFFESWRKILFVLTGIGIIYLAYLFYNEAKVRNSKDENVIKSFIDNIGSGE